jgi:hypothetical protein
MPDIEVAKDVWGKAVPGIKGKVMRKKPIHVTHNLIAIPRELINLHKRVFLTADLFFVNKIPFFLTYSRKICCTYVTHLENRKVTTIFKSFVKTYRYYKQHGFDIESVHADGEFGPLQAMINEHMPNGPFVNLATTNEHVPEIERRIQVVKERTRAVRHSLPYKRIPHLLMIWIVFGCVRMLNFFPAKGGISSTFSPKTIMTGETLDYKKHLCLKMGQYCQVHEEENPQNGMKPRSKAAICLGLSGNTQGGFKFMSLNSGKRITRRSWDALPIPDTVIARVNELGRDQPEDCIFTDR